jgi:protein TonB
LNTGDLTYLAYFAHIKQKIERVWDYPAEAVNRKVEGQLLLLFVLQRSGQVKGVEFLRPSGFEVLDRHAWDAVVKAGPFDPIPSHIPQDELRIRARFTYILDTERQRVTVQ